MTQNVWKMLEVLSYDLIIDLKMCFITATARRQYELLKKQTKMELRHTLDNLLEGSEQVGLK